MSNAEYLRFGKQSLNNWHIRKLVGRRSGSLEITHEFWDAQRQIPNIVFHCDCCHKDYHAHSLAAAHTELKRGICLDCFGSMKRKVSENGRVYLAPKNGRKPFKAKPKPTTLILEVTDANGNKYTVNQTHLNPVKEKDFLGL